MSLYHDFVVDHMYRSLTFSIPYSTETVSGWYAFDPTLWLHCFTVSLPLYGSVLCALPLGCTFFNSHLSSAFMTQWSGDPRPFTITVHISVTSQVSWQFIYFADVKEMTNLTLNELAQVTSWAVRLSWAQLNSFILFVSKHCVIP